MLSIVLAATIIAMALCTVASLVGSTYTLDQLIRREYEFHRAAWDSDGRPTGFMFFRPPEIERVAGWRAYRRFQYGWLFATPKWVVSDPQAKALLARTRRLSAVGHLGMVVVMFSTWIYMAAFHYI